MKTLITGGSGFIGAHLARELLDRGEEVLLLDLTVDRRTIDDIRGRVGLIAGDISRWPDVLHAVRDHGIDRIFHLGAMITSAAEANPPAAFFANAVGSFNVLEAARLFDVQQTVYAGTIGTYGQDIGEEISDETVQHPITMYGATKLVCEAIGRVYRHKFGLDFRGVRFPTIIGPGVRTPGAAYAYACLIEAPAKGKPAETRVAPETRMPTLYYKDAVRGLLMLGDAPSESIRTVVYTISGVTPTPSAAEVVEVVRGKVPDIRVIYNPDAVMVEFIDHLSKPIDDGNAKREWGWSPQYGLEDMVTDLIGELRSHPELYAD
jgi:nucleoside-diphosphate-sugar epimerase